MRRGAKPNNGSDSSDITPPNPNRGVSHNRRHVFSFPAKTPESETTAAPRATETLLCAVGGAGGLDGGQGWVNGREGDGEND